MTPPDDSHSQGVKASASIFDIPHIMEAITQSLMFTDLRRCILVNRQWHSGMIPYLWTDVINFRSYAHQGYESHKYYFLDPDGRPSLAKHARHIQALTCQDSALLPVLFECGCTNLIELNYVIEEFGTKPSLGLDHLAKLIAVNPGLLSVSIENVPKLPGGPSKITKELLTFVTFLSQSCPSVTCFYLAGDCLTQPNITNVLLTMLYHRLASLRPQDTTVLHIKSPRTLSRSKRGPPATFSRTTGKRMYNWPARYVGMISSWGVSRRWENTYGKPYAPPASFAVLASPRSGVLEVTMPPQILSMGIKAVLAQCPKIVSLHVDAVEESRHQTTLLEALKGSIAPGVKELRVDVPSMDQEQLSCLLHGQDTRRIARISVREVASSPMAGSRSYYSWMPPMLDLLFVQSGPNSNARLREDLGAAIVDLEMSQHDLRLGDMLLIMSRCGNLERFRAKQVFIDHQTPPVSPVWACSGSLLELSVWFVLDGSVESGQTAIVRYERSVKAANRIVPSMMEQLRGMVALRELELHMNHPGKIGTSPFFEMAVEPLNGLGVLARLGELRRFEVSGLLHSCGHAELVWMKAHWTHLMSLSIPNCKYDGASMRDVDVQDLDQDYWDWLGSLEVKKGFKWSYGNVIWSGPNY